MALYHAKLSSLFKQYKLVKLYSFYIMAYRHRQGKTGVATTLVNKDVDVSALLDLKHLLVEAKQRIPPVLQALDDPEKQKYQGSKG